MDRSRLVRLALAALVATLALASMAVPAEAATISINSFSVSPGRVIAAGGKITFTWNTSGAATCSLSSDVHLNTLPAEVTCGRHSKAITLPGATSTSNNVFTFAFTARTGSLATTAKVRVTRNAIWPKVDAVYKSIQSGTNSDSLRVRANVRFARTCTLSVTPSVAGLPSSANCANGSYFTATSIPKNSSAADRTYNIKVSATSPTGVTVSRTTTIVQRGLGTAEPSITRFGLTPSALAAAGGTYTFSASVTHASTCSVTITPAVANPPAPVSCTGGTYSQKVVIPANTGATAKPYSFTFTAANNVGSVSATISASQPGAARSISPR